MRFQISLTSTCIALLACMAPPAFAAPSLVNSTPNMQNPATTEVGSLDFWLVHRFDMNGGTDGNSFEASPTFVLSTGVLSNLEADLNFATGTAINANLNKGMLLEPLLKYRVFPQESAFNLFAMAAYNSAAISGDGALMGTYDMGPLSLRAICKVFSSTYGVGGNGAALGAGAIYHVNANWGLCADFNQLVYANNMAAINQQQAYLPAWGLGANFNIPYSPHSLQLYITNANTFTLEGTSRGTNFVRYGFDFSIPFGRLSRYAAIFNPPQD
jgi:hypothetical protein